MFQVLHPIGKRDPDSRASGYDDAPTLPEARGSRRVVTWARGTASPQADSTLSTAARKVSRSIGLGMNPSGGGT